MTATERETVQALLAWYAAMGADEAIGDYPVDCFAASMPTPSPSPPRVQPRPRPAAAIAAPGSETRIDISQAGTLAALEAMVASFEGCALKRTAKSLCFKRGRDDARIMLIGEAPGRDEDLSGKPFVGRAGQLLDRMLGAIGLAEDHVYITNTVYWRPPGNRTPTPQEGQVCRPFLERQLELVEPEIVLLFGGAAAKHILDTSDGIMRIRGKWRETQIGSRTVKVMATLHPAYLLRTPAAKRQAWRDLLAVRAQLGS
jgi:uracil-DNA glycosylase family 4